MDKKIKKIFEDSIEIEELMEKLYLYCSDIYPEHSSFFLKLAKEEREHAELLETVFKFKEFDIEVNGLHLKKIDNIPHFKDNIKLAIEKLKENKVNLKEICLIALNFENSATELHVQDFIFNSETSEIKKIIQFLGEQDKYHAHKIFEFMKKNNLL